jgi:hypothetical protein
VVSLGRSASGVGGFVFVVVVVVLVEDFVGVPVEDGVVVVVPDFDVVGVPVDDPVTDGVCVRELDRVLEVVVVGSIKYGWTSKVRLGCPDSLFTGPMARANPHSAVIRLAIILGAVNVTFSPIGTERPNYLWRS